MSRVTITQAAKLAGISRQHFYRKFINNDLISITKEADKTFIDISELLRVCPNIKDVTLSKDNKLQEETLKTTHVTEQKPQDSELVTILKIQLEEANQREQWLKSQIDEMRQQQTLLLEDKTPKKRKKFLGIF